MARNAFYSLDFFNFFSLSNAKNLSACAQGIPNSAPNCSNIEAVPVTVALFSRDKGRSKNSLFPWNGNSLSRSGVSNLYSFTVCATLKLHPFNHASHYFSSMLANRLFAVGIWLRATFKRFKKYLSFTFSHILEWFSSASTVLQAQIFQKSPFGDFLL